jgi:hypothetical protein
MADQRGGEAIENAFDRLHRAVWSIGSTAVAWTAGGLAWVVSGANGENVIRAVCSTEGESWRAALGQARSLGTAPAWRLSEPGPG